MYKTSDNKFLCILNSNELILNFLEEELEENVLLFSYLTFKKGNQLTLYFLNRETERN